MTARISPGTPYGFFTDTSICIGCKACEVACKEWNQLPGNPARFGDSYDSTGQLDAMNWRHVQFREKSTGPGTTAWLMMSDVCKHCNQASCMDVCPTGAIIRTEFDTVFIQQEVCNGCRNCISACPFGVIGFHSDTGTVRKCTLCYDRLQGGMQPACAQACPTQSIRFGPLDQLHQQADARLAALHGQGHDGASLYGRDDRVYGGLGAFFLLMDRPETYGLPSVASAVRPGRNNVPGYLGALLGSALAVLGGLIAFRRRGEAGGRLSSASAKSADDGLGEAPHRARQRPEDEPPGTSG